jgi:dienelactone hydrolase
MARSGLQGNVEAVAIMQYLSRRDVLAGSALLLARATAAAQSNVDEEIIRLAEQAPLAMQFRGAGATECRAWQRAFDAKLRELLGPFQPPSDWKTITERTIDAPDHRRVELLLRAAGHPDLPVYLLVPRPLSPGKHPGILALHGHGKFGYDSVAGIRTTPDREKEILEANYDYGLQLVRRGYVVAVPCFLPFGRRLDHSDAYGSQDPCGITFLRLQLLGKILMAENLRDALWTFDLLSRQGSVDTSRLGCVGLSYGGRMTMLTSAMAPRIKVAVISGALNVMQERVRGRYDCGAQIIPGLLNYGDVPEIASLIAPRPCLWEVGLQDSLMVQEWIQPALHRIRHAYEGLAAAADLDVDYFAGGHRWNGVKAYPLLEKVLKPAQVAA